MPQVLEVQQHGEHPFELAVEMDLIAAEPFQLVCVQRLAECLLAYQEPIFPVARPLRRSTASRAAMHSATGLTGDRWRLAWGPAPRPREASCAWRKPDGSRVFRCMGLSSVFVIIPPPSGLAHRANDGLPAGVDVHILDGNFLLSLPSIALQCLGLGRLVAAEPFQLVGVQRLAECRIRGRFASSFFLVSSHGRTFASRKRRRAIGIGGGGRLVLLQFVRVAGQRVLSV